MSMHSGFSLYACEDTTIPYRSLPRALERSQSFALRMSRVKAIGYRWQTNQFVLGLEAGCRCGFQPILRGT